MSSTGSNNPSAPVYETTEPVRYEARDEVAILSLNRPRYKNAQNNQMTYALDEAFQRAARDDGIRAIILRAEGDNFCSGHDLGSPGRDVEFPIEDPRSMWWSSVGRSPVEKVYVREQEIFLEMCRRWRTLPKPTIAAVHGACIAGGLMLAWICDLIIASEDAYFVDPVLQMGIPGVEYFAHAFEMHPRIAREFLFLGEKMDAARAYEVGMVNRVVPREQLMDAAVRVAERLKTRPRFGLALAKQALNFVEDLVGKRSAIEGVFAMHQVGHAHSFSVTGGSAGGITPSAMRDIIKQDKK